MTVITHPRRSRLADMIDSAGGVTVGVALHRAHENIAALRDRGLEQVARSIAELALLRPPASPEDKAESLRNIYRLANHVIDAAGPFDLDEICAVAAGLCDMVDRAVDASEFDWRILAVHIRSLELLNALPPEAAGQREAVTAHLAEMVAKKFGQAAG